MLVVCLLQLHMDIGPLLGKKGDSFFCNVSQLKQLLNKMINRKIEFKSKCLYLLIKTMKAKMHRDASRIVL